MTRAATKDDNELFELFDDESVVVCQRFEQEQALVKHHSTARWSSVAQAIHNAAGLFVTKANMFGSTTEKLQLAGLVKESSLALPERSNVLTFICTLLFAVLVSILFIIPNAGVYLSGEPVVTSQDQPREGHLIKSYGFLPDMDLKLTFVEPRIWQSNVPDFLEVQAHLVTYWDVQDNPGERPDCELIEERKPAAPRPANARCVITPVSLLKECKEVQSDPNGEGSLQVCSHRLPKDKVWLQGAPGESTFTFLDVHIHDCGTKLHKSGNQCSWEALQRFWAMNNAGLAVDFSWLSRKPIWQNLATTPTERIGKISQRVHEDNNAPDPLLLFKFTEAHVAGRSFAEDISRSKHEFSWLSLYTVERSYNYCERNVWLCGAKYSARVHLYPETVQVYDVLFPTLTSFLSKVGGGAAALLALMTAAVKMLMARFVRHEVLSKKHDISERDVELAGGPAAKIGHCFCDDSAIDTGAEAMRNTSIVDTDSDSTWSRVVA
eukprot:TRINITY_DN16867_c0_g1_i3.p1 TRINITY_DN16867_c0_g1~~TRINITY_DN16867_c0_g1_i3.p1  ORF type:complete len:536 (-),score=69.72 TRINITY_DN16867_c0_g1_i3:26-1504(-)